MSKSLKARCIRRWEVEFKGLCDSKISPWWRKRHLRGYIRDAALTTADFMVERMAEDNARVDFCGHTYGWSPEFGAWYYARREQYRKEALAYLNDDASNEEIDEMIQNELVV
ncbi:hypothetical protein FJP64_14035 [Kosakonia cowanii]|uniref:hypothetical protein n=1 Tax=Kosakonia cowanii TaxID=208223 RepID=UPI0011242078|nr:hypothetical protein [Kosakonia cowanii]MDP9766965.1 hypothetical protein [Atlantibacter hermannii]TPD64179.1 hypothetical protein FJP70_13400 [Kosakonia cowanii]TPD88511.1 hypothetical protein FJP67_13410 [Kosakonia cowanii]TPE04399.1 hypothetical protein FJP64_14035 [Kosakonia cowanii]